MSPGENRAAVAAGVLKGIDRHQELLRSIVEVARSIFQAQAASIMLFDSEADELVFAAVVGEGERGLIGSRFPADSGIAGFVLASGEPIVIEDLESDPRFARELAERTGYVPRGMMVVPLLRGEETAGVLSVLDRPRKLFSTAEMDLLALFATQAAIALDLDERTRRAIDVLELESDDDAETGLGALGATLERIDDPARRRAALDLLDGLLRLLQEQEQPPPIRLRRAPD